MINILIKNNMKLNTQKPAIPWESTHTHTHTHTHLFANR